VAPTLVFDLETVPDIEVIRKLNNLDADVTDKDVVQIALYQRRQKVGHDFLPHHLQKIVAISCVLKTNDNLEIWSIGSNETDEAGLLKRFFDGIEKYIPNLVTWNGSGFDLPVLNYRALANNIQVNNYFDTGENNADFKWNNYLSRYHKRHLDLMDFFALYNGRSNASLDHICKLCNFPGKLDMDGGQVWETYLNGGVDSIRNYCETDVANTYLVFLRYLFMKGDINFDLYINEIESLRQTLLGYKKPHWNNFIKAWGN
jgi:predicted PolB exonuclease-like 3'-5' exonuclease